MNKTRSQTKNLSSKGAMSSVTTVAKNLLKKSNGMSVRSVAEPFMKVVLAQRKQFLMN